jgi:hypothetical protein
MWAARAIAALLLFALFLYTAGFNVSLWWRWIRHKDYKGPSQLALFPGVVGALSFWISPYDRLHHYAWVPLVLDPGTGATLLLAVVQCAEEAYQCNPLFRVATYCYRDPQTSVVLRLYRKGRFTLEKTQSKMTAHTGGHWAVTDDRLVLQSGEQRVAYLASPTQQPGRGSDYDLTWSPDSTPSILDDLDLGFVKGRPVTGA